MATPQLENGHTRIANEILEKVISSGLNGTEISCLLFIWRKTYGYQKLQDEISLSQFCEAIPVSKQTICTSLYNLQLVKIITLVKKGSSKNCSNLWAFNKDYDKWQLVKKSKLVKFSPSTSQVLHSQLVKKTLHTKEIQKKIQKKGIFFENVEFNQLWDDYVEMRKKIKKPMTDKAKQIALKKLENENVDTAIKMLEQSVFNSWQGLFPVKNDIEQEIEQMKRDHGDNTAWFRLVKKHTLEVMAKYYKRFDL